MFHENVQYYIIEDYRLQKGSMQDYMELFQEGGHIIEHTTLGEDQVDIWTCLAGYDQRNPPDENLPPLLFETSVLGLKGYDMCDIEYTSTLGQARNCHYNHVIRARHILKRLDIEGLA